MEIVLKGRVTGDPDGPDPGPAKLVLRGPTWIWGEEWDVGFRLVEFDAELTMPNLMFRIYTPCAFHDGEIRAFAADLACIHAGQSREAALVSEDNLSEVRFVVSAHGNGEVNAYGVLHAAGPHVFLREDASMGPDIAHFQFAFGGLAFPRGELLRFSAELEQFLHEKPTGNWDLWWKQMERHGKP